jgi:SAM-dependent methyltransferase
MANKNKLLSLINQHTRGVAGAGLEIGASFDPIVAKRDGYNVEVLDHLSAQELRVKYKDAPGVNLSMIEEVDHISDGGSILDLIGKRDHYDYIVASHVIEHTVDVLGFLLDCESLLKRDGALVLAVPDTRFSFDCLRPLTTTGQVMQAHAEKGKRHSIGKVFDELAYNCLRDGAIAWPRRKKGALAFFRPLSDAKAILEQYRDSEMFIDIHAWQFTPSSFRLILSDLNALALTQLREKSFDGSSDNEFFMVLARSGEGCRISRMDLAQRSLAEQREIITKC